MQTTTGTSSLTAVASSCIVIWKPPSPLMSITVLSGWAILAPMLAGSPKPMVPRPPELTNCRGYVYV